MSTNGNPLNRGNLESSGSIDAKIALKAALMIEVSNWIAENNLTQEDAAVVLGISRQQISDVVAQKLSEFTVDTLVSMLIRAGKKVSVSVSSFDPNQTTISCWSEPKNRERQRQQACHRGYVLAFKSPILNP